MNKELYTDQLSSMYPQINGKYKPMYPIREAQIVSKYANQQAGCSVCAGKGDGYMLRQMELGKSKPAQGGRQGV